MNRRYKLLLALAALIAIPFYWLLVDNSERDVPQRRIDIAELRRLAGSIPGPQPDKVVAQEVGWKRLPGAFIVAGGGLKRNNVVIQSFLLTRPGAPDIVIDSGITAADARALDLETHLPVHQRKVESAMRRAGLILFTHEHVDHLGGLLRMPDAAIVARRALLNPDQLQSEAADELPWPADLRSRVRTFPYNGMAAVAPGVVLIRTPGHTPGSQMIYARLSNGREYLFAGDTATMERNWRSQRARSRLLADIVAPEDRANVLGWLSAIADLKRQSPALVIVPGHDFEHIMNPETGNDIYYDFARMDPMPPPKAEAD